MGPKNTKMKPIQYQIPQEIPIESETPDPEFEDDINQYIIDPNSQDLISVTSRGNIFIHETNTYQIKKEINFEHSDKDLTNPIIITSDGKNLIIGFSTLSLIGIWSLETHEMVDKILLDDGYHEHLRAFYEKSSFLSIRDKTVYIWDLSDLSTKKINTFPHKITAIEVLQYKDTCLIGFEGGYFTLFEKETPKDFRIRKPGNVDFKIIAAQPSGNSFCTVESKSNCFKIWDIEMNKNYCFFNDIGSPEKIIFVNDWSFLVSFGKVIQYRTFPKAKIVKIFYMDIEDLAVTPDLVCYAKLKENIWVYKMKKTNIGMLNNIVAAPTDIQVNIDSMTESFKVPISPDAKVSDLVAMIKQVNSALEYQKLILTIHNKELAGENLLKTVGIRHESHVTMFIASYEFEKYY